MSSHCTFLTLLHIHGFSPRWPCSLWNMRCLAMPYLALCEICDTLPCHALLFQRASCCERILKKASSQTCESWAKTELRIFFLQKTTTLSTRGGKGWHDATVFVAFRFQFFFSSALILGSCFCVLVLLLGPSVAQESPTDELGCQTGKPLGGDYKGTANKTVNGRNCQKWSLQKPHGHIFGGQGDHNYCRNPDGEPGVWCYTTDPEKRWELCHVPECANLTKGKIQTYIKECF